MSYVKENKQLYLLYPLYLFNNTVFDKTTKSVPLKEELTIGLRFTFTQIKYLHISLLAKINREEKYNLLTNQNGEEIGITEK